MTSVDESGFAGTVKVKLGPIALQYAGTGQFVERDDAAHRAVIEAKGKDKRGNGTAGATVTVQLAPAGEGTRIDVTTDLSVTGKPAQFGRGVMQDVSDKLLQQFVQCIEGQFAAPEPEAGTSDAAVPASEPRRRRGPPAPARPLGSGRRGGGSGRARRGGLRRPRRLRSAAVRPAPQVDDSIDLGATVLPVLVKSYAPYAVAALAGLLLGWLLGRRQLLRPRSPRSRVRTWRPEPPRPHSRRRSARSAVGRAVEARGSRSRPGGCRRRSASRSTWCEPRARAARAGWSAP